jgi:trehalose 6-phosphate phosphatase
MSDLQEIASVSDFLLNLSKAPASVLMLDYDGTLAPFQIDRHKAYPYPGVLPLLEQIQQSGKTRMIVITGRPVEEVQTLLRPFHGVEIWGAHGLEHQLADGTLRQVPIAPESVSILEQARDWLAANGMADRTEVKPGGVAVHWRGLAEKAIAEVRTLALIGWNPLARHPGLKLLSFEGGLELRISRPDKGDAVAAILEELHPDIPVAFLGDDLTDEDAFHKLARRGLSILVRSEYRQTEARVWLKPPQELISFLAEWLSRIRVA